MQIWILPLGIACCGWAYLQSYARANANIIASIEVEDIQELDELYEIIITSELFHVSLEKLEKKFGIPRFSNLEWRALNNIEVSKEDDAKNLFKLLEKLEDLDDVQNVSSNFNINDSLMEKVI